MSIVRSDNFFYTNPKPSQEYERKLVAGSYEDWVSTSEINSALDITFRKNKYFWINAVLYQCDDDGVTYRAIGGPLANTTKFVKIAILSDSDTVNVPELTEATSLAYVLLNGIPFQDFVDNGNMISYSGSTLNMTNAGGVHAGDWMVVFYK